MNDKIQVKAANSGPVVEVQDSQMPQLKGICDSLNSLHMSMADGKQKRRLIQAYAIVSGVHNDARRIIAQGKNLR